MSKVINLSKSKLNLDLKKFEKNPLIDNILLLPDAEIGSKGVPVSTVFKSRESIVVGIASSVINCGIQLSNTNIKKYTEEDIKRVFHIFMKKSKSEKPLSYSDLKKVVKEGAKFIVEKKGLNPSILENMENGGNIKVKKNIWNIIPFPLFFHPVSKNIGYPNLRLNHFLEAHEINIINENNNKFEIEDKTLSFLFHTDSIFSLMLNWSYFFRASFTNISKFNRFVFYVNKILHHFILNPSTNMKERYELYLKNHDFPIIDKKSKEYERYEGTLAVGMNYAYAQRILMFSNLQESVKEVFGSDSEMKLIWDSAHDSIQQDSDGIWASRKGAGKRYPNKPALILGSYNYDSLCCIGIDTKDKIYDSYDHGSSHVFDNLENKPKEEESETVIYRWDYNNEEILEKERVKHLSPDATNEVFSILNKNKIVDSFARLKPLAGIKQSTGKNPHVRYK